MPAPQSRYRQPRQLDAEGFQPEISSFGLYLAAEGKAAKTVRTYTEAVAWFAAAHLLEQTGRTGWEQAGKHDVQQWMVWLLGRYSTAYASNRYRDLCFYTARSYSFTRPPRTARRLIYSSPEGRHGVIRPRIALVRSNPRAVKPVYAQGGSCGRADRPCAA